MSWVLITGATSPLGKKIALSFAQSGKNIVIHYHNHLSIAKEIGSEIEAMGQQAKTLYGEFSTASGVDAFLKQYRQLDLQTEILIYNVGPYNQKSLLQSSVIDLQETFQTNFFSSVSITKGLLPDLQKTRGSVIYLGFANLSRGKVFNNAPGYVLAKETLAVWTRSLAKELSHTQVRVNMVSPGYLEHSIDAPKPSTLPQGRLISCKEVADFIQYLASPLAKSITGQNIDVAGGIGL
ncbi:MAG: SDR family NAD(P)-dependent oxidoreductase [Chlamydiales bacterium]